MDNYWQCYFKRVPDKITVGEALNLFCDGDTKLNLTAPVTIEFLDKQYDYSLVVLKTLKKEDYFLALQVAPYRTGRFEQSFYITDGKNKLKIDNLSFDVQSVLTKKSVKPYGPYGPFKLGPDSLYVFVFGFCVIALAFFASLFTYRFFKRKKFVQSVLNRHSYLNPSKFFAVNLRKEQRDLSQSVKYLEHLFKIFLEDCLFIPVVNQSHKQIIRNLKKYQSSLYKKNGANILQILSEFSEVKKDNLDKKTYFELKKICQKMVFLLDETKGVK
ncbi:MAG: hypothetical protein OXN83_00095 [Oligoflexia bacterium]|nr:hypothetical protein [Oligoflexia bacterium]